MFWRTVFIIIVAITALIGTSLVTFTALGLLVEISGEDPAESPLPEMVFLGSLALGAVAAWAVLSRDAALINSSQIREDTQAIRRLLEKLEKGDRDQNDDSHLVQSDPF